MDTLKEKLITWLFETKALRVCPQDQPFWYTSGTIGPYYINTHFLYGSEEKANDLLSYIDREKENRSCCPLKVLGQTEENYRKDSIYRGLIDEMLAYIKANLPLDEIDYISGGERRDWFFSLIIAEMLGKPHITIYKDLSLVVTFKGEVVEAADTKNKKVLHIADLITEASSYERAWVPAINSCGANMLWSIVVVDRKQGGEEVLAKHGVKSFAMIGIDEELFGKALEMGYINQKQQEMIMHYIENPKEAMRLFLINHPEFLRDSLHAGGKTAERAQLCLEQKIYGIDVE